MTELKNIKKDFPILNNLSNGKPLVYLDSAATTQKPQIVLDSIIYFYSNSNSNIHRGVNSLSLQSSEMYEQSLIVHNQQWNILALTVICELVLEYIMTTMILKL